MHSSFLSRALARMGVAAAFSFSIGALAGVVKVDGHTFTVADGYELELVAKSPLVDRPIAAAFDEQGRLYVSDSSGSNEKGEKQLVEKSHRVVRLTDSDGDGKFDKSTVFADKFMFPEGAMWRDGSLYVGAPPSIWKLTDTDDDGVADTREEWFKGGTVTGCANDMHGPYNGPDGLIYWCKGAFAKQTHERPGLKPIVTRAAHVFRSKPDHGGLEFVMTGGMDNPVEVAFSNTGERFFTTTFLQEPEGGRRDGIIHAIYGGIYGKVNDVVNDHVHTSPDLMPVTTHLGPAAPCGLTIAESTAMGLAGKLLACQFNLHKVSSHTLQPENASYKTLDADLVSSEEPDFHPTDVIEDADGSLIILDTGGWYKICCPTSQLAKPDVLGAVYRLKKIGMPKTTDPRGLKLEWNRMPPGELAALLGDIRPAVRQRAIQALAAKGAESIAPLQKVLANSTVTDARRSTVWTLCRLGSPAAMPVLRTALSDSDESVRHAAAQAIAVNRDVGSAKALIDVLERGGASMQRVAAEALGRLGDASAAPALLATAASAKDPVLKHSCVFALIELGDAGALRKVELAGGEALRLKMVALDQMENGGLTAAEVLPLLDGAEPAVKQTATWIIGRHSEWAPQVASHLKSELTAGGSEAVRRQLATFASSPDIQKLVIETLASGEAKAAAQVLQALAESHLKETPRPLAEAVLKQLASTDAATRSAALAAVRSMPVPKDGADVWSSGLMAYAGSSANAEGDRLAALAAVPPAQLEVNGPVFEFLLSALAPAKAVTTRSTAARVLSRSRLGGEQLGRLTEALKTAGPLELSQLLAAFEKGGDEPAGLKLVAALKDAPAFGSIRPERLKAALEKWPEAVKSAGGPLLASISGDAAQQAKHLDEIASSLPKGDIRRGQAVFASAKAACSTCHAIGYLGGKVGPDLTSIGTIRTERDLLESVVYPSASFVRSFEPMIVSTKGGDEYNGVLKKDGADEVLLVTGPNAEVRIARADIAQMRPGAVSIMPQGLDQQLSKQELADLVAFLKGTKWGAN